MNTPTWARPSDLAALRKQAAQCLADSRAACLVEVTLTKGSAPREAGARMLVTADSEAGTIGGGHLEYEAVRTARESLQADARHTFERQFALGPTLGQCCGGAVALRFTRLTSEALSSWPAPAALHLPALPVCVPELHDNIAPLLHIQLHGAGHVGRAIVAALADQPFTVQWVDEREGAFPADPAWFAAHPHIECLSTDSAEAEAATAPPGTVYLVLTHSHDLDLRVVHTVLQRGDFAFCGLIGSKTKRERFRHRLAERGVVKVVLDQMTCPIGASGAAADSTQAKWPEVIAAGVALQLIALAQRQPCALA